MNCLFIGGVADGEIRSVHEALGHKIPCPVFDCDVNVQIYQSFTSGISRLEVTHYRRKALKEADGTVRYVFLEEDIDENELIKRLIEGCEKK